MSWALFKANFRENRAIWLIMTVIFCFYMAMIISMFDPNGAEALKDMVEMLPETLRNAFGFGKLGVTLVSFITGYIYGFLVFLFPMVVSIVVNHRLIASHVDKGSMAYLLATPNTRRKIAMTQAAYSMASITALFFVFTAVSIFISEATFPGLLDIGKFILVNIYALLLYYTIGGIGFFASCIANEGKTSLRYGIGIPGTFLVLQMLGGAGDKFKWIGNLSLYALFAPLRLIEGDGFAYLGMAIFTALAVALYYGGITVFEKRDLHV